MENIDRRVKNMLPSAHRSSLTKYAWRKVAYGIHANTDEVSNVLELQDLKLNSKLGIK